MSWKRIVVDIDGTPESLWAVEQAARITSASQGLLFPVRAMSAIPTFPSMSMVGPESTPKYSPELRRELLRVSHEQIRKSLNKIAPGRYVEPQTGPTPFVIGEEARVRRAELVVLGSKRQGKTGSGQERSAAHYLAGTLEIPLLITRESTTPIKRMLAAIDLSPASLPTIKAAQSLAELLGARLGLMHVIEPFRPCDLAPPYWNAERYHAQSEASFWKVASPVEYVQTRDCVVRQGVAADKIIDEALAWHADVIVVGTRGTGWVDRVLLGTTTLRLVNESPISLLVAPVKRVPPMLKLSRPRVTPTARAWRQRLPA